MPLFPTEPEIDNHETEAQVMSLQDNPEVFKVLQASMARHMLCELHEEPAVASELADRVETSIQNAKYHLDRLHGAGLVEVIDTCYSCKGNEMVVYAPTDAPLTIVIGDTESTDICRRILSKIENLSE